MEQFPSPDADIDRMAVDGPRLIIGRSFAGAIPCEDWHGVADHTQGLQQ
jgi:hypothetical protein